MKLKKQKTASRGLSVRALLEMWVRERKASAAIEFSLLAIPYLLMSLAVIELSLMYASATLLEGATNSASRLIRTGEIQQGAADPEEAFRAELCNYATVLIRCNDVTIEAETLASFADYTPVSLGAEGEMVSQGFALGGSNDRVLVRVGYQYSMMTPLVGTLLYGMANGRLFVSTIVLQTEPYEFAPGG